VWTHAKGPQAHTCHVDVYVYNYNNSRIYCCSVGGEKDGLRTQLRQAMETVDRLTLECRALEPVAAEVCAVS
jgi:hypothetical protein